MELRILGFQREDHVGVRLDVVRVGQGRLEDGADYELQLPGRLQLHPGHLRDDAPEILRADLVQQAVDAPSDLLGPRVGRRDAITGLAGGQHRPQGRGATTSPGASAGRASRCGATTLPRASAGRTGRCGASPALAADGASAAKVGGQLGGGPEPRRQPRGRASTLRAILHGGASAQQSGVEQGPAGVAPGPGRLLQTWQSHTLARLQQRLNVLRVSRRGLDLVPPAGTGAGG
mmetsp:Transcript_166242/g.533805  ORF Transcript_166242/g.533805 Transcript_166242/m.533805 type:complete len:233 (+) Transcript_166242:1530-2228(+)